MRPMLLEFPDDPTVRQLDRQYMLGRDLLVAPVFSADGEVEFYLPEGQWTDHWTGRTERGGRWVREQHGFDTLPLYIREGAVIPWSARDDRPDHPYLDGLTLRVYPGGTGQRELVVTEPDGRSARITVTVDEKGARAVSDDIDGLIAQLIGGDA